MYKLTITLLIGCTVAMAAFLMYTVISDNYAFKAACESRGGIWATGIGCYALPEPQR